jgi:hypothetical protein
MHCVCCLVQEAKLRQWQLPNKPSSTLDNFAAASGYGSFAADAMARVRARLAGFDDDDTLQQPAGAAGSEHPQAETGSPQPSQQQQGDKCYPVRCQTCVAASLRAACSRGSCTSLVRARLYSVQCKPRLQCHATYAHRQQSNKTQTLMQGTQASRSVSTCVVARCAVLCCACAGGHAANPAAERVLDELLLGCCCREERATLLPEACMSPGLEVSSDLACC